MPLAQERNTHRIGHQGSQEGLGPLVINEHGVVEVIQGCGSVGVATHGGVKPTGRYRGPPEGSRGDQPRTERHSGALASHS